MGVAWKEEHLDFILVPCGLLILFGYQLFHLQRCLYVPHKTVIGYENYNRKAWVKRILQLEPKERGLAVAVISGNLSAATSLSSVCLVLSSLIGALVGSSYSNDYITSRIYGNTTVTVVFVKYIGILMCFMVAFACFVQTARCFVHANFLISMPDCEMPVKVVESAVIRGSNFWVVGLRALYFAISLMLWIFGPIPMFCGSVITMVLLWFLDKNAAPLPDYDLPMKHDSPKKTCGENTPGTQGHSPNGTPAAQHKTCGENTPGTEGRRCSPNVTPAMQHDNRC